MHVLVNAASAHMGGAVTYLQNVLRWVPVVAPDCRFTVFVPAATRDRLSSLPATNVRLETYPFAHTSGLPRLFFDQVYLPYRVYDWGADVLFSSTGFGTFFSPCPEVLLVRNLAYFDEAFQARYRALGRSLRKNTLRRWMSLLSIMRADTVLFPTRAMQRMVEAYTTLNGQQVQAIHYGFDHEAFAKPDGEPLPQQSQIAQWKAEGYHILLNVSTFAVQKNFETLIEALAHLAEAGLKVKLLTTTSRARTTDTAEYDALVQRAERLGVRAAWVELGYVPYGQLSALYEAADVYVFPSFTESFGHSMVEAMASGLPVVAAETPVNREVCGEAGLFFGVYDAAACAASIEQVVADEAVRQHLREASRKRAEDFSWQRYVEQLVDVLRQAAHKN